MSELNNTSIIDEKKKKETSNINRGNIGKFIFTITILFIIIIFYYSCSGLLLFACKLGQSNILPTNKNCFPYQETKPNIEPIETNIFTTYTDPALSLKLKFPYDKYNSSNKILDLFRNYKNETKSNFLVNYFISIMEDVLQFNYYSLNSVLNSLNGLPEIFIVLLGPIFISFITTILLLLDFLYLIYLWFANMSWFFKKNNQTSGKPMWENLGYIDLFNFKYLFAIILVIIFSILFLFSLPLLSIVASLAIFWASFTCLSFKAEMNGKNINSSSIVQDFFKYYKLLIIGIYSFLVVSTAFSTLGTLEGIFSLITLILIYFGFISINLFKPENPDNLTLAVSYQQAKKTCNFIDVSKPKHGLFYQLLFGQKGGNITKELKNIGKKLSGK
jgi:hypothetical protein